MCARVCVCVCTIFQTEATNAELSFRDKDRETNAHTGEVRASAIGRWVRVLSVIRGCSHLLVRASALVFAAASFVPPMSSFAIRFRS